MITQDAVDKISDDFSSTFALLAPNVLSNLFYENEVPTVEAIIKKHVPDVYTVFTKQTEVTPGYFLWTIEVSADGLHG